MSAAKIIRCATSPNAIDSCLLNLHNLTAPDATSSRPTRSPYVRLGVLAQRVVLTLETACLINTACSHSTRTF